MRKVLPPGYVAGPHVHSGSQRPFGAQPPPFYAASCRWIKKEQRTMLEAWSHVLKVGQPLPILPLWPSAGLFAPLDLEQSYEQACSDLGLL